MLGNVYDRIIMHANFGEDRLMGFGVARGRFFGFSNLRHRHYNTRALYRANVILMTDHSHVLFA